MSNTNEHISKRIWVVFIVLALFGFAIIGKVFKIQIVEKEKWSKLAASIDKRELLIPSTRGDILSTDGTVLAVTVPTYSIYWDSQSKPLLKANDFNKYKNELAENFAKEFPNRSKKDFLAIFDDAVRNKKRYQPIVKKINFTTKQRIEKFPFISRGKYKSGFIFEKKMTRTQLFDNLAGRTIGKTYAENLQGRHGLELTYNKELAGVAGKQLKTRIPGGAWKPVSDDYIVDPVEGLDLISSIDVHLQDLTQFALKRKLQESQADWGCAILMEVETGYVRAITNLVRGDSSYYEDENKAINALVDPGSTFKLPVMMSVLEDNLMSIKDSIDTGKGYIKYYDKTITDTHPHGKGTLAEIFAWSSNVGMAKMVDKCYKNDKQKFLDRLNSFHLGEKLGVEIVGERKPKLYQSTQDTLWSGISHVQLAMGYEVNQTPIQTLAFYNAIANNGKMMKPLFAEALTKNRKEEKTFEPIVLNKHIASNSTIATVKDLLIKVCHDKKGTANVVFKNSPYLVAGKTGTARILEKGKYQDRKHRGSFVGYFPANNPKYSCIVVIHNPRNGSHYGAGLGAPVFKEIADQIFNAQIDQSDIVTTIDQKSDRTIPVSLNGDYKELQLLYQTLGIEVKTNTDVQYARVTTENDGVKISNLKFDGEIMPDLKDMSVQDAIFILENMGMQVKIKGVGRIKKQSIKKGTKIEGKNRITLELA